jgi:beta-lactamase superfamily II metal-dependent hydrolase
MLLGHERRRARTSVMPLLVVFLSSIILLASPAQPASAAVACTTPNPGEVTLYWLDVEQGDGQLLIGPSGRTLLIDLGETAWNSTGSTTNVARIEALIRSICGTGASPVALDYVMASHHHLDHIGYAWNPQDAPGSLGNGLWKLLTPTGSGGYGFTVGTLLDHDGGTWTDANGDGKCTVGTSTAPDPEIAWHNVGTTSQTARRWICWLYGPASQADRANIAGHVVTLTNTAPWPAIDLGTGVAATILNANGKDTMQANGVTPVSGDHSADAVPPSENDYSIAVKVTYGGWRYATAGDSDGEYNTSANSYTYNNIEAKIGPLFGAVDTMRANHHGSDHSTSQAYVNTLTPVTAWISCGNNSYGHPGNRMLDALRTVVNPRGTGADIYIANNPCDTVQADGVTPTNYAGLLNTNGDVVLHTTGAGTGYVITYSSGTNTYVAYGAAPQPPAAPTGLTATAGNAQVSLSWTASTGATSYNVKRATATGGPYTVVASGVNATTYTNTGLTNGTTYFYVVSAVNGVGESANSNEASATPIGPPAAPTGLTATAGNAQVSLSWTAATGATSYYVKRATATGGPYTLVASGVTATTYTNTGLTNGTTYFYVVSAVNGAGESPNSNEASATPTAPPDPSRVVINEFSMAPNPSTDGEWVELYNPTATALDISGLYIDDVANGGGAPKVIPAGTIIAAHGYYVMTFASGFLNNTGAESVRYLRIVGGVETVYDIFNYNLASTHYNQVFHRQGDGGAWCNTISSNVTKGMANPSTCP